MPVGPFADFAHNSFQLLLLGSTRRQLTLDVRYDVVVETEVNFIQGSALLCKARSVFPVSWVYGLEPRPHIVFSLDFRPSLRRQLCGCTHDRWGIELN
jgi:hypothetical protein